MAQLNEPIRFDGERLPAWVAFLHAHARMIPVLDADLKAAGQVPLRTYDVLVQLSEAGGSLRLRDLLHRIVVSQPGLSRMVERLTAADLVSRKPDPKDRRGVIVALTRAGRAALRAAAPVHMRSIARVFAAHLSDAEAAVLARVFERLLTVPLPAPPADTPVPEGNDPVG